MKRYLAFLILQLLALTTISAKNVSDETLLFTTERVESARQRMQNDKEMQQGWETIKATADGQLKKNDIKKADYVVLAWMMTHEQQYADCLKAMLHKASSRSWSNNEMMERKPAWRSELQMAGVCYQSAVAYSAIRQQLSEKERKTLSKALFDVLAEPSLGDWLIEPTRIHSLNSMGHNWWTACVYEGALLAMAISNDQPQCREWVSKAVEALPLWFGFEGDVLQNKPRTFDRNGGMYESVNYASFGISEALRFLVAWHDRNPKAAIPEIPQLSGIVNFFVHTAYPRTGELFTTNFGDGHRTAAGELPLCLLWALGHHDNNILWYTSQVKPHQHREGCFVDEPTGFILRPDLKAAPKQPKAANEQLFADMGWATLRTSWQKDGTMLAVKSGHTWNHNHADNNSFMLFHQGSQILKDCGNCFYGREQYRKFFFQSEAHNTIKVNGEGQSPYQQYHGTMLDGHLYQLMANGNIRYVLGDATGPMSDQLSRWFRHWLWIDDIIYVIDDIHAHQPSQFEWLWHYSGEAQRRQGRLDITDGNAAVSVIPLYPQLMAPSDFVHDYPELLRWEIRKAPTEDLKGEEEYYALQLPEKAEYVKGVTAIVLKENAQDKTLPVIERRDGKDWKGLRVHHKGRITDLYINQLADGRMMHRNSWICCDGFETDAYMLAFNYTEGKEVTKDTKRMMVYGSALRREGKVWFSSLTKQFIIE